MQIISRADWGARPPKRRDTVFTKTGGIVVHYTAVDSSGVTAHWPQCYERWQRHQNYHMDTKGWNDLAYNFGVCKHGFIFEGRGWEARNGANTPENSSTLSVCVDVDGNDPLDDAVIANLNNLISEAVSKGWAAQLRGHYQVSTSGTACPGANLKEALDLGRVRLPLPGEPVGVVLLLGGPSVSILAMQDWARTHNASRLYIELAGYAYTESVKLGVDPAVTYAIMGHETAFGRFGGVLDETFHNWGGIKTAQGGDNFDPNAHQRFNSHHLGVIAVVQHVAGYAGIKLHQDQIVDPRFHLLEGKRIAAIPSVDWTWASTAHDDNVVRYVLEMKG